MREGERKGKFEHAGLVAGPQASRLPGELQRTWNSSEQAGTPALPGASPLQCFQGVRGIPTTGLSLMEAPSRLVLKRIRGALEDTEFDV